MVPMYRKKSFFQSTFFGLLLMVVGLAVLGLVLYQLPPIHERVAWRIDYAMLNVKSWFNPVQAVPTPLVHITPLAEVSTPTPQPTATSAVSATPSPTPEVSPTPTESPTPTVPPTPIPGKVLLPAPGYEKEDLNACGPATLAMNLRFWDWKGDQKTISDVIKPIRADRNVNVEELAYYVNNQDTGLHAAYRVGGNMDILKKFVAAGLPIMVESGFKVDKTWWANDDRWVGHYLLITGYDDANKIFFMQDSEKGPNTVQTYDQLDKDWQVFNRVYIMVYPPDKEGLVQQLLGADWDMDANRQHALDAAKAETEKDPQNGYAWFNLGTNLTYFERYTEAAVAYDQARQLKLPQRMLRYQFGPFIAYFHSGRTEDLMALVDYALERTPNSEEALLWKGWGLYRQGKRQEAIDSFNAALEAHPNYGDAQYALNYVYNN